MPRLTKRTNYPLADRHPAQRDNPGLKLVARYTGEVRTVREGEWYLSGAVIEAYRSPHGTRSPYPIAKIYQVTTVTRTYVTELEDSK